ncbi:hypothetical protein CAPTEDRAFT_207582 [Capitella teleta]|uniref:Uncharacterized protein n=1 Tax=Capitella teleta TaxID=283909 RepID=R7VLP1_CAPTE|nr:hypothetical protein CAPTEDRAFT_207582 [Capitella teleta]|eukprot:ELU17765.1 hypothetical protein CAPTEDRAFT_207582 [Capitella teleta]
MVLEDVTNIAQPRGRNHQQQQQQRVAGGGGATHQPAPTSRMVGAIMAFSFWKTTFRPTQAMEARMTEWAAEANADMEFALIPGVGGYSDRFVLCLKKAGPGQITLSRGCETDFLVVSNAINRFCTDVHIPQSVQLQHEYTVELIGDPKRDVYAEMVEGMAADPILVPDFAGRGELTEDGPVENPARDRAVVAAFERIKQRKARRPRPGNAKATPMMGGRASELGRAREVAGEYEDEDEDGSGLDDRKMRSRLDDDDDGEEAEETRRRGAHYMPEAESAAIDWEEAD